MAWVPSSRSKFVNWTIVPSLYSWKIAECDINYNKPNHIQSAFEKYVPLLIQLFIVEVSHLCTTNFMNYIPIFFQLLKELPQLHQVVEKVPLENSRHPVLIEKRGVFRTSQVRLRSEYELRITATYDL